MFARRVCAAATCAALLTVVAGAPAWAASDGPGYGGNANSLNVTWVPDKNPPSPTPTKAPTQAPVPTAPATKVPATKAPATQAPPNPVPPAQEPDAAAATSTAAAPASATGTNAASSLVRANLMLAAATPPKIQGNVANFALQINAVGFQSATPVRVQVGNDKPLVSQTSNVGSLNVVLPGIELTSNEPGQSISAMGKGPSGTQIVLTGSIPPVPAPGGIMEWVPWIVGGICVIAGAVTIRRKIKLHLANADESDAMNDATGDQIPEVAAGNAHEPTTAGLSRT